MERLNKTVWRTITISGANFHGRHYSVKYRLLLVDLDGTVYCGDYLITGVEAAYLRLKERGVYWLFLTNNSTMLASDIGSKIRRLGIPVSDDQVINSISPILEEIRHNFAGKRMLVIGHERVKVALDEAGAIITQDPDEAHTVLVTLDRDITYTKLTLATRALLNGAEFWAANVDSNFPDVDGFSPGAGSIVAAIAKASGKSPDKIFGKPSIEMARVAMQRTGCSERDCLVVGDRMDSDIQFALNAGMHSALVLSGSTRIEDLSSFPFSPNFILDSLCDLISVL